MAADARAVPWGEQQLAGAFSTHPPSPPSHGPTLRIRYRPPGLTAYEFSYSISLTYLTRTQEGVPGYTTLRERPMLLPTHVHSLKPLKRKGKREGER